MYTPKKKGMGGPTVLMCAQEGGVQPRHTNTANDASQQSKEDNTANTLEDDDPNRVPKQAEQTKNASQLDRAGMGFGHRGEVSRCANSFDKPKLLCSTRSDPYINRNDR